jgi:deoxyribodipyrimidine photo-lyase
LGVSVQEHWQSSMLDAEQLPFDLEAMPEVFTAFRHRVEKAKLIARSPVAAPRMLPPLPTSLPALFPTADPTLIPTSLASPLSCSLPGVSQAQGLEHLKQYFGAGYAQTYKLTRNQLSGEHFSTRFSPWLATGTLSAPTIVQHLKDAESAQGANESTYWIWFELLWRDYFRFIHLKFGRQLYAWRGLRAPDSTHPFNETTPLNSPAAKAAFERWAFGETKNALVNAGMNELRATGWMSNRMRQIVASYLIYDLKLDWRAGASWFETHLLDYDVYSNQGNWLYIAGLGTDPRGGRRMNLEKQALEHDPKGLYRAQWTEQ